jgi:hypothetical protein
MWWDGAKNLRLSRGQDESRSGLAWHRQSGCVQWLRARIPSAEPAQDYSSLGLEGSRTAMCTVQYRERRSTHISLTSFACRNGRKALDFEQTGSQTPITPSENNSESPRASRADFRRNVASVLFRPPNLSSAPKYSVWES